MENDTSERVRLTISVTPEVHQAFTRLAAASGMSLSRAMGEWLGDTLDAVEFVATKVEQAREAPKLVMREMHAYALGMADEAGEIVRRMRGGVAQAERARAAEPPRAGGRSPSPPSSNTGGKVPNKRTGKGAT